MMKKIFVASALLTSILFAENNLTMVEHSISFKFVDVSKSDTNRVLCENGEFGKIIYSKDKEIKMQKDGANAFIKLSPVITKSNGILVNSTVNDFTRDVYLECDSKMYSLNLVPKDLPAQTIVLMDKSKSEIKGENIKAKEFEKANSFEKTMIDIIKSVYKDTPPAGYTVDYKNEVIQKFDELEFKRNKVYSGNDYNVSEYLITAKNNIEIDEKMFVPYITLNPLALALTDLNLSTGQEARLLVVSNSKGDVVTIDEKKKNFQESLAEFNKKNEEDKLQKMNKTSINQDVLDFIGDEK